LSVVDPKEPDMACCPVCKGEMRLGISCVTDPFVINGRVYDPIPWGHERRTGRRVANFACRDCGVPPGAVHHHGCDQEECPVCHGQAISCSCDERGEFDHTGPRRRSRCAVRGVRPHARPRITRPADGSPPGGVA
jgi:hypothetical protein